METVQTVQFLSMPGKDRPAPQQARSVRTRQRLLAAGAEVVRSDGVTALTLERVAEVAGVSKGGLLYHFATKQDLIVAMLGGTLAAADDALARLAEPSTERAGAFAHAYLDYVRSGNRHESDEAASVFAAAALDSGDLTPAVETFERWQDRLLHDDGLDPTVALLARVVGDGLWLIDLFGLAPPDDAQRAALCDLVASMIDDGAG